MADWMDWIGTALDVGGKVYGWYEKDKAANNYIQAQRDREQYAFDQAAANNAAYAQWAQGAAGHSAGNAAAAAAAHAASEAARMQALQEAMGFYNKQFKKSNKQLKPYAQMGKRLIEPVEETYKAGLSGLNQMAANLLSPQGMAPLSRSSEFMEQKIGPLPEWLTSKNGVVR